MSQGRWGVCGKGVQKGMDGMGWNAASEVVATGLDERQDGVVRKRQGQGQ